MLGSFRRLNTTENFSEPEMHNNIYMTGFGEHTFEHWSGWLPRHRSGSSGFARCRDKVRLSHTRLDGTFG